VGFAYARREKITMSVKTLLRISLAIVPFLAFSIAFTAPSAVASSVHFKNPPPTFTDNGLTLTAGGALAGLGNGDVIVKMTATADPTATCTNQGGNQSPGQNPASVTVTGSEAIPASEIKNGTTPFRVTTDPPPQPTPKAAGCPGNNWTAQITDMLFKTCTIEITQGGRVVLTQTFNL
jgi:hypothetical protein